MSLDRRLGPDAVSFVSASRGWSLGVGRCRGCGVLDVTTDGGRRWRRVDRAVPLPGGTADLAAGHTGLFFANRRDGYAYVGSFCAVCLIATHDGGRTWHPSRLPAVTTLAGTTADGPLYALTRGPHDTARLYRTVPGSAATWHRLAPRRARGTTAIAASGDTVVATQALAGPRANGATRSRLAVSIDRGRHWTTSALPCPVTLTTSAGPVSLAPGHPSAVLLDCYDGEESSQEITTSQRLYGSVDRGRTWVRLGDPLPTGAPEELVDNGAGHAFLGVVNGFDDILEVSTDGALSWHRSITLDSGGAHGLDDLRFVSADVGYVLGPVGSRRPRLFRTTDAGLTWHRIGLPT